MRVREAGDHPGRGLGLGKALVLVGVGVGLAALSGCAGSSDESPTPTGGTVTFSAETSSAGTSSAGTSAEPGAAETDPALDLATADAVTLLDAARNTVEEADSLAVTGRIVTAGGTSEIDLRMHSEGTTGTVVSNGERLELRRVRGTVYVRSDEERVYTRFVPAAEAPGLRGRWLQISLADPRLSGLGELTSLDRVAGWSIAANMSVREADAPIEGAPVEGAPAVVLRNTTTGAQLRLTRSSPPYPVLLKRADDELEGELRYSAWNEPVEVVVPTDAVEISD